MKRKSFKMASDNREITIKWSHFKPGNLQPKTVELYREF